MLLDDQGGMQVLDKLRMRESSAATLMVQYDQHEWVEIYILLFDIYQAGNGLRIYTWDNCIKNVTQEWCSIWFLSLTLWHTIILKCGTSIFYKWLVSEEEKFSSLVVWRLTRGPIGSIFFFQEFIWRWPLVTIYFFPFFRNFYFPL